MVDGGSPAYALAIAQAIARGQGTPQQRSAFLGAVAQKMGSQFNTAMTQAGQARMAGQSGGAGLAPPQQTQLPWLPQAFQQLGQHGGAGNSSGGAGLAPPGVPWTHPIGYPPPGGGGLGGLLNPGGPGQVNPGGPMQTVRPGGPVKPIGPAWPPRTGTTQINGRTYGTTSINGQRFGM